MADLESEAISSDKNPSQPDLSGLHKLWTNQNQDIIFLPLAFCSAQWFASSVTTANQNKTIVNLFFLYS